MEYKGKLYGHLGDKMYFDTGKTSDDWDALEKRLSELEEKLSSYKCSCGEESTGSTKLWCCNICGKPQEDF